MGFIWILKKVYRTGWRKDTLVSVEKKGHFVGPTTRKLTGTKIPVSTRLLKRLP